MAKIEMRAQHWNGPVEAVVLDGWNYRAATGAEAGVLKNVRDLAAERRQLDGRIRVSVQELRQAGASWSVVGDALGVTRSAAQKRYGADELPLS